MPTSVAEKVRRSLLIGAAFCVLANESFAATIFDVPVGSPWTDTGIDVIAGQLLVITTDPDDTVIFGVYEGREINADGVGDFGVGGLGGYYGTLIGDSDCVLPGTVAPTLIGKIGGTTEIGTGTSLPEGVVGKGAGFVGTYYNRIVPQSGRLYLGFNDSYFPDNVGVFATEISVDAVPEPTSLTLWLGLGVAGLIARRRKRTA